MKKDILQDNSTCCSVCFEMLSCGDAILIDDNNDVTCNDCNSTTPILKGFAVHP